MFEETITHYGPGGEVERVDHTVIEARIVAAGEAGIEAAGLGVEYTADPSGAWALRYSKETEGAAVHAAALIEATGQAFGEGLIAAIGAGREPPAPDAPAVVIAPSVLPAP